MMIVESFGLIFPVSILDTCDSSISAMLANSCMVNPLAFLHCRTNLPNAFMPKYLFNIECYRG